MYPNQFSILQRGLHAVTADMEAEGCADGDVIRHLYHLVIGRIQELARTGRSTYAEQRQRPVGEPNHLPVSLHRRIFSACNQKLLIFLQLISTFFIQFKNKLGKVLLHKNLINIFHAIQFA